MLPPSLLPREYNSTVLLFLLSPCIFCRANIFMAFVDCAGTVVSVSSRYLVSRYIGKKNIRRKKTKWKRSISIACGDDSYGVFDQSMVVVLTGSWLVKFKTEKSTLTLDMYRVKSCVRFVFLKNHLIDSHGNHKPVELVFLSQGGFAVHERFYEARSYAL